MTTMILAASSLNFHVILNSVSSLSIKEGGGGGGGFLLKKDPRSTTLVSQLRSVELE
jgi:hypothetical protein